MKLPHTIHFVLSLYCPWNLLTIVSVDKEIVLYMLHVNHNMLHTCMLCLNIWYWDVNVYIIIIFFNFLKTLRWFLLTKPFYSLIITIFPHTACTFHSDCDQSTWLRIHSRHLYPPLFLSYS